MPAAYPPEERERITLSVFQAMEGGKSLREACRDEGVSHVTVLGWCDADTALSDHYARARDALIAVQVDELLDIADDGRNDTYEAGEEGEVRVNADVIARSRLRVDVRKWALSKIMPKRMGDKIQTEHSGSLTITHEDRLKELG